MTASETEEERQAEEMSRDDAGITTFEIRVWGRCIERFVQMEFGGCV